MLSQCQKQTLQYRMYLMQTAEDYYTLHLQTDNAYRIARNYRKHSFLQKAEFDGCILKLKTYIRRFGWNFLQYTKKRGTTPLFFARYLLCNHKTTDMLNNNTDMFCIYAYKRIASSKKILSYFYLFSVGLQKMPSYPYIIYRQSVNYEGITGRRLICCNDLY